MADHPKDIMLVTARPHPTGRRVLILTDDKVQDLELFYPYYRLSEEGYTVDVATPRGTDVKGEYGLKFQQTVALDNVNIEYYDLLYIPGGKAPSHMRKDDSVISFIQRFAQSGKPVAAFCHGPQLLIAAGLTRGKRLAAWPEIEDEIIKAGGVFVNEPVVKDGQFITGRFPGDLPVHLNAVIEKLQHALTKKGERAA